MTRAPKTLFKGLAALACLVLAAAAGAQPGRAGQEERAPMPDKTIEAVLETHSPRLMDLPGVVGVGEGGACSQGHDEHQRREADYFHHRHRGAAKCITSRPRTRQTASSFHGTLRSPCFRASNPIGWSAISGEPHHRLARRHGGGFGTGADGEHLPGLNFSGAIQSTMGRPHQPIFR